MEPDNGNKTGLVLGIAALVVLLIIGIIVLARPKPQPQPSPAATTSNPAPTTAPHPDTPGTDQPSQNETGPRQILIQNFSFQPASLTVKKGTVVTWTNQDSAPHTVTSDSGSPTGGPGSGQLSQGQSYSFTFNTVGAFAYHCSVHPNMHGLVTVTN